MKFDVLVRFRETIPAVKSVSSIEIQGINIGFLTEITIFALFPEIGISRVLHSLFSPFSPLLLSKTGLLKNELPKTTFWSLSPFKCKAMFGLPHLFSFSHFFGLKSLIFHKALFGHKKKMHSFDLTFSLFAL